MTSLRFEPSHLRWLYGAVQAVGLVLTGVLVVGLVMRPTVTLHVLWDMVIPLLPAVFLVNPMLWRNVCPLATLNTTLGKRIQRSPLRGAQLRGSWTIGIALLVVMVPARRFLFNTDGRALAATILAVGILALLAGVRFSRRAGFCNTICPVLPVEKLYGQGLLMQVGSARCRDCTLCTPIGCIDLARDKTVAQTLGANRRDARWLMTPFGAFAAAFPGFVVGYFTLTDGPPATAGAVYWHVLLWATASVVVAGTLVRLLRIPGRLAVAALGGLAAALYYWFAATGLSAAYGAGEGRAGEVLIRAAALGLVAFWFYRTRSSETPFKRASERIMPVTTR